MLKVLKNTWLGLTLIVLASLVLLYADLDRRQGGKRTGSNADLPRLAVMQWSSTDLLDNTVAGIVEGLRQQGYEHGRTAQIRFFNASGDNATGNAMARDLSSGAYDMILTASTLALQAAAKANEHKRVLHVFGGVTNPYEAGVGITGPEPDQHPPHLVGVGTFQPVERAIALAKQMNPALKKIGVVWNPGESNSEACLKKARETCNTLNLELLEANAGNTSEVPEAVRSILARGCQAVWVGGDTVAISALSAIVAAASAQKIPVFTNDPSDVAKGALFGLGASYHEVGVAVGKMAGEILNGASPESYRIDNFVPEKLSLNEEAAAALDDWSFPEDALAQARAAATANATSPPQELTIEPIPFVSPEEPYVIAMVNLLLNPALEAAEQGVLRGIVESGMQEGKDFTLKRYNAQGDIAQLPTILDAAQAIQPKLIVTLTTPVLMAAVQRVKDIPMVFTVASDPAALGLFSPEQRPAHITGVHDDPPMDRLLDMAMKHDPTLQTAGIVYDPAQPNAVISLEKLRTACTDKAVALREASVVSISDLKTATKTVLQQGAKALLLSADNLIAMGFPAIVSIANEAGAPIFVTETDLVQLGAAGAIGNNYERWGAQSGHLAAKVLAGASPADLPLELAAVEEILSWPTPVSTSPPAPKRPWEIRIIRYNDAQFSEDARRGIMQGFEKQGWREGVDFNVRCMNAQGDMTTLISIVAAACAEEPDMLMTISTPSLQAALRHGGKTPIVFSSVADAVMAGAGTSETDHLPHVAGITTRSPFESMARLIKESVPGAQAVGTLFSPAEINSELYREWFAEALEKVGLTLLAVPVNTSADTSEAASALLRKNIQLMAQISDNTTRPAFPQLIKRANEANLPFFCFDSAGMNDGAALSLARDYVDAGAESAAVAVRVLQGESPKNIPFANLSHERLTINPALLSKYSIALSPDWLAKAETFVKGTAHHEN